MKVNDVPAKDGLRWISEAFTLFRAQPMAWISLMLAWFAMWLAGLMFPLIGIPLMNLLGPTFLAGLMLACRDQTVGKPITALHLFAAFKTNARPLLTLGAIILLVNTLLSLLLGAIDTTEQAPVITAGVLDVAAMRAFMLNNAGLYALVFGLSAVVMAIFWFAVPLLVLPPEPAMPVSHAIRWSFFACVSNVAPMLVFAMAMIALTFLAVIPLGVGMIVLAPVFVIATYTSYLRVFSDSEEGVIPSETPREES